MFGVTETETETENVWAPAQPVVKCLGVTGTENVWAPAQPVVKCLGVTGNVWRARQPVKIANPSIAQPVDSPTRRKMFGRQPNPS